MPVSYFEQPMSATPVLLGTGATVIHTVPTNARDTIQALTLTNNTGTARTFSVYNVPAAGSPSTTNLVGSGTIPANSRGVIIFEVLAKVLTAGGTIQGLSDAAAALAADGSVLRGIGSN